MSRPLVTCICPTSANRGEYLPDAIQCFLDQTYHERELVIVGEADLPDIGVTDPRIKVLRLNRKYDIGRKRNMCIANACGDVILHWDDDDLSAPHRIERQVDTLYAEGCDLTGSNRVLFTDDETERAWVYLGSSNMAVGTTLCYHRTLWERQPFQALDYGEDNDFVRSTVSKHIVTDDSLVVARCHPLNTCPRLATLRGSVWTGARGEMWQEVGFETLPDWFSTYAIKSRV